MKRESTQLCECGCGQFTYLTFHGKPQRFRHGHWARLQPRLEWSEHLWEERECGYSTPCWIWLHTLNGEGYGRFRKIPAHRVSYEKAVGPIPDGLEIDHLCRVHACVRPEHLEPVTRSENIRRGWMARKEREWRHS